jgi:hypothetical protein
MKNIFILVLLSVLFFGCTTRPPALPKAHAHDLPWGAVDLDINSTAKCSIKNSLGTVLTQKANRYKNLNTKVPFDILTLTGGGSRGAFGTGLLVGWNEKGDMPNFDIVTGISTGAVMAPFIFLGGDEIKKLSIFIQEWIQKISLHKHG